MGDVHLARLAGPAGFQRWVVVKVLLPELAPSPRYRDMFFAEARLAARLAHPNVCEVLDLGEERGTYYIVMPYLDGVPLAALMERPAGVDPAWYLRLITGVIAQACEGLHHAHQLAGDDGTPLGVVHRDVSPSNVMVLRDGVAKVLDFGIAKSRAGAEVTEKDIIKGKPAYMAPEQLAGGAIDRRADLFCVGILLWEALAQRSLFQRASSILSARAVLEEAPPPDGLGGAPPALAALVMKALAKEPFKRPASAEELRRELVAAMADGGGVMNTSEIAEAIRTHWGDRLRPAPAPASSPSQAETVARTTRRARSRPWLAIGVVAAGVTTAAVMLMWPAEEPLRPKAPAPPLVATPRELPPAPPPAAEPPPPLAVAPAEPPHERARHRKPAAGSGKLSVDSTPWATIYVDGKRLGITPLIDRPLAAGKHQLRAVAENGREQSMEIEIRAGAAQPIRLSW